MCMSGGDGNRRNPDNFYQTCTVFALFSYVQCTHMQCVVGESVSVCAVRQANVVLCDCLKNLSSC